MTPAFTWSVPWILLLHGDKTLNQKRTRVGWHKLWPIQIVEDYPKMAEFQDSYRQSMQLLTVTCMWVYLTFKFD